MKPASIKAKGRNAENLVVGYLQYWFGGMVERRRLNGVHDRGDVAGIRNTVIEVKSGSRIDLAGWLAEAEQERVNDDADWSVVVIKPKGVTDPARFYAVVPFGQWCKMRGRISD